VADAITPGADLTGYLLAAWQAACRREQGVDAPWPETEATALARALTSSFPSEEAQLAAVERAASDLLERSGPTLGRQQLRCLDRVLREGGSPYGLAAIAPLFTEPSSPPATAPTDAVPAPPSPSPRPPAAAPQTGEAGSEPSGSTMGGFGWRLVEPEPIEPKMAMPSPAFQEPLTTPAPAPTPAPVAPPPPAAQSPSAEEPGTEPRPSTPSAADSLESLEAAAVQAAEAAAPAAPRVDEDPGPPAQAEGTLAEGTLAEGSLLADEAPAPPADRNERPPFWWQRIEEPETEPPLGHREAGADTGQDLGFSTAQEAAAPSADEEASPSPTEETRTLATETVADRATFESVVCSLVEEKKPFAVCFVGLDEVPGPVLGVPDDQEAPEEERQAQEALLRALAERAAGRGTTYAIGRGLVAVTLPGARLREADRLARRLPAGAIKASFSWGSAHYPDEAEEVRELLRVALVRLADMRDGRSAGPLFGRLRRRATARHAS
jgi:hypothetical protein